MTLYLKYRPQTISELDTKTVRETLLRLFSSERLPHAFLLTGSRGLGKTSTARIMAKVVNCADKKQGEPCNVCDLCVAITNGTCPDVIEIDAASNRGIDDVRELRDKVRLAPIQAKVKVYIIDEVHMLTLEAANALLKTLEEPPANTLFILCTTDPQKLPDTVVSRCVEVRFNKPSIEEMSEKLSKVAAAENLTLQTEDLRKIARSARGSFRDAIKLLEQVKISNGSIDTVLGMVAGGEVDQLFDHYVHKQRSEAIDLIEKMADNGIEFKTFIEQAVLTVKERLMEKVKVGNRDISLELNFIEGLQTVYEQMRLAVVAHLPLEVWILKWASLGSHAVAATVQPIPSVVVKQVAPMASDAKKDKDTETKSEVTTTVEVQQVVSVAPPPIAGENKIDELKAKWSDVLKVIKPKNHSIEALLRSTRPVSFDGASMQLEVAYKFHKDKLETEKCRSIVEMSVGEVFGTGPVKLFLVLSEGKKPVKEEITGTVEPDIIAAAAEIFKVDAI